MCFILAFYVYFVFASSPPLSSCPLPVVPSSSRGPNSSFIATYNFNYPLTRLPRSLFSSSRTRTHTHKHIKMNL